MNLALQQTGYYRRNQQGYRPPRRSLGGQHLSADQRTMRYGEGYDPRTAAKMYGGRPTSGQPQQVIQRLPNTYRQPLQQTQMQAVTRPQVAASTYTQQPWGGVQAVRRQKRQQVPQQAQWGW